jgi:hypothetical protein
LQGAQVIERNIHKTGANLLNFPILFQDNGGWIKFIFFMKDMDFFSSLDLIPETENENLKVSIQEQYHPLHAPLECNFKLSCAQFEINNHNEFKDEFKEPPLDVHKDFIQYNHDENVARGLQWWMIKSHKNIGNKKNWWKKLILRTMTDKIFIA